MVIVKDGELLLLKGYGLCFLVFIEKIDENIIFSIGFIIKVMVVVVMGMLVDEGLVFWDDKVLEYLFNF